MSRRFQYDHPVEYLRGSRRESLPKTLKSLLRRAEYITQALERRDRIEGFDSPKNSSYDRELRALGVAIELAQQDEVVQELVFAACAGDFDKAQDLANHLFDARSGSCSQVRPSTKDGSQN